MSKASKTDAGYVYRKDVEYHCDECWKFMRNPRWCAEYSKTDKVETYGYCTLWAEGEAPHGLRPQGSYTKQQTGYGEEPDGTLCKRCDFFLKGGDCQRVDKD